MLIKHPQIFPSRDYPYGVIAKPHWNYRAVDGNTYCMLDGQLYNTHPFSTCENGFGIRWVCNEAEQKRIVDDREFLLNLCRF